MFDDFAYKPFRKRHPFVFIFLLLFFIMVGGYIFISLISSLTDEENLVSFYGGKQLGVVNIEGVIWESKDIVNWTKKLEENDNIVGVLVRVNSPGGAVTPSEEIYFALRRLAEKKPVVVSMGTVAASGGYMVSLPAQSIIAAPSTITGSIGTRMDMANWGGLMDKIGIKDQSLASGSMKDAGSPYRDLSQEDREYFMGLLTDMHEQFIDMIAENRENLTRDQIVALADGRVFTGRQALQLGLVDGLGDKEDAIELLSRFTGYSAGKNLMLEGPPKKRSFFDEMFESMFQSMQRAQVKSSMQGTFFYF